VGMLLWVGINWKKAIWTFSVVPAFIFGFHRLLLAGYLLVMSCILVFTKQKKTLIVIVLFISLCMGIIAPEIWNRMESYQQQRILTFLGMRSDPHGAAYQVIQSKVAIGSGGILGKGLGNGTQSQLRFLPEQHTDFIFSVIGEEFGFIGVSVVILIFMIFFLKMLQIGVNSQDRFGRLAVIGALSIIIFQFAVNIGMTVGWVPVTGLPLPFLSYGGSSLLISMGLVGVVANIGLPKVYT